MRVDYLNDLDKLKNSIEKQARQNISSTREWKRTHEPMKEARLPAESFEKMSPEEQGQMIYNNGQEMETNHSSKYLGLIIESTLEFEAHLNGITKLGYHI